MVRRPVQAVARWLAPSVIAACAGAIVAGVIDAAGTGGALGAFAAAGFLALLAVPLLVVASAAVRGLWAAWRPREVADQLIDADGSAPRLVAWLVVVWLVLLGLAWATWQSTLLLAMWTAFKPVPVSLAEPIVAVAAACLLVGASRPAARGLAWLLRRFDARHRVTPRRALVAIALATVAIAYIGWRLYGRDQLGPLDVEVLRAPAVGLAACVLVHAAWQRAGRARVIGGAVIAGAAVTAIAVAVYARVEQPSLVLAIWGDRPVAGFAVDLLFDLDAIHDDLPAAELAPTPRAGAPHPDIILVTIDTVRADHTPPYDGTAEMPALRQLAGRGTVFDFAFSPSNVTRRSIPSMMIGLAPNRVKGRVVGWALRVDPRHVMVAERLAAGGYDTAGFMCCGGIWGPDMHTGLSRGLAHLEIEPRENGFALAKLARAWIEARDKRGDRRPLFVWMHLLEPHNWNYGVDPKTDDDRRRFYDRSLQQADLMLGDLLGAFAQRPPDRAPIVIVTADHGEGLGDHGQPFHSTDLYDSQIRVPLVIAGPGIAARRVGETVSLTDLAPTLLALAGFEPPRAAFDGASFAELATGARAPDDTAGVAFAAMIKDRSNPGGMTAIVKGGWKLIDNVSSAELYDVHTDPAERANVITTKPAIGEELRRALKRAVEAENVSPFD